MDPNNNQGNDYSPSVGSLWKAPNRIWTTGFARNSNKDGLHPSIVERIRTDKISLSLTPGTTKNYKKGSCVYRINLNSRKKTYFLLNLAMPYLMEDLIVLKKGWNNVRKLNNKQLESFLWQIKMCKGL